MELRAQYLHFFFRILHKDGFSQQDLEMIKPVIYSNCIHCMLAILRAMFHLQIEYENSERVVSNLLTYFSIHTNLVIMIEVKTL